MSTARPFERFTGLIAAPFTAFQPDGSLNLSLIDRQAESLVAGGVRGAFVCGTTGEGASLSTDERMRMAQRWVETAGRDLRVLVHVGHNSLPDARALAEHAQRIGAAAVSTLAPSFFKPAAAADLVAFCREIAAAAPELPFFYYHIPGMTGVNIAAADFLRLAIEQIPTFAGIKFTHENLMDYHQCLALGGDRCDVLFGRDEILLSALVLGARGAVGSTYNYAAPVYTRVMAAFAGGDLETARAEQARAVAMIDVLVRYGGLPAGKAIMRLTGLDCGPVRLPLRDLNAERRTALRRDLEAAGFFECCAR